jgi:CHAT domain-containing protein
VVLSACETGSGRVAGGEGPISLARAFVQAGAGHVVATLWPVRANAGQLMEAFHARLDAGLDPSSALREAKVTLIRQGAAALDVAPFIILSSRR